MKIRLAMLLAALSLLAFVPVAMASSTATTSSPSSGDVTYHVQLTANGTTRSASVTESVSPSSTAGNSIIALSVEGTMNNFTYSHIVNSSLTTFPYLPGITSDNYTYVGKNYTVFAKISDAGTSLASFNGQSYSLSDYSFSAAITDSNGTQTITGTVTTFPSDLVYSVATGYHEATVSATLTATTLPLTASSASPALQATSAGVGISLAVGAVALSLGVKFRHRPQSEGPKPDYWVD